MVARRFDFHHVAITQLNHTNKLALTFENLQERQ